MSDKNDTSLVPRPSCELARIPPGASAIIDGMVNDVAAIIRTDDATRHRIGNCEFRESDYQQILIWAEAVGMTPDKLVMRLQGYEGNNIYEGHNFVVSDGAIMEFRWCFRGIGLDLSQVPRLKKLDCGWQDLTELDLSRVPHLEVLNCQGTYLTELDLSRVPHLKRLSCGNNHLTKLDLSQVPHLEALWCGQNHLTELELSRVPYLKTFACFDNCLTALDLSRVPHLKTLNCAGNYLTKLDLSQVPHLKTLWCWTNKLIELDLSHVLHLEELNCRNNPLTDLGISVREKLKPVVQCDPNVHIHKRKEQNPTILS